LQRKVRFVLLLEGSNGGHAGPMRSAGLQLLSLQFAHAHLFVLRLCRLVRTRACAGIILAKWHARR
jgi:hypothetical protein